MSTEASGAKRTFPPGVGWVPLAVAISAVVAVSVVAVTPQFRSRIVGSTSGGTGGEAAAGGNTGGTSGGQQGSAGTAGHTVNVAGSSGTQGKKQNGLAGAIALSCAPGKNGGNTGVPGGVPGVSASEIHVASSIVTTGVGSGFLGQAADGMLAAAREVNNAGGICGRKIYFGKSSKPDEQNKYLVNSEWDGTKGQDIIGNFIGSGDVFALVGQPDSEGLHAATISGLIDRAAIPVVGSDGMLKSQYNDPWIWPLAASTVTNMHIIAQYSKSSSRIKATNASDFGIVYDTRYKFGAEGAIAFDREVLRQTGGHINGYNADGCQPGTHYCGISADAAVSGYTSEINAFGCNPCKVVVLLLEPGPAEVWMNGESNGSKNFYDPYGGLFGGEPLFDDNFAHQCNGCGGGRGQSLPSMIVWTGYRPPIYPFDSEQAVSAFCNSLHAISGGDDCHNEFTEGAYMGTKLFIEAVKRVCNPQQCLPLTRENLRDALNSGIFDFKLSQPLRFGTAFPRVANSSMGAFQENAGSSGVFQGWNYLADPGFIADPHSTEDLK